MVRRLFLAVVLLAALTGVIREQAAAAATGNGRPSPTKGVVLVNTNLALLGANAAGTGIVLTKDGEVLTNNHVIAGATTVRVTVPATRKSYVADVVGYDIRDDVALLQLEGAANLPTASMGNSTKLRIGQGARAVGNANGGGKLVVTSGKILALNRTISVQQEDGSVGQLSNLVATSARLVPGDSGGPLIDASGRVIGVDAAGSANAGARSTGFAIAINQALAVAKQIAALRASPLVHIGATAFVGVQVQDSPAGVSITAVFSGSPAQAAGLVQGDVVTSIGGAAVSKSTDVRTSLFGHHPGDQIAIGYTDPLGNAATVTLTLAAGPPQ